MKVNEYMVNLSSVEDVGVSAAGSSGQIRQ